MADYYGILGVDRHADSTAIRAAYKKLAMQYHPDRNPGDAEAEEMFKKINEAYHTLSDPIKKSRYDNRYYTIRLEYTEEYLRELNRIRYSQWQRSQEKRYKLGKEYFRIQGLAFLVFIVISGFCFAIIHTANYFIEQKNINRWNANSESLKQVNSLFVSGNFKEAFQLVQTLHQNDPMEFRFGAAKDSLVSALRGMADEKYDQKDFFSAVRFYLTLKNYEEPVRFETLRRISVCQYHLGNYQEALLALKELQKEHGDDLELIYVIGMIHLEKMDQTEDALQYFELGKQLFQDTFREAYGPAFKVIMNPQDAADIYYDIFEGSARANIKAHRYDEAVKDCRWAIHLRPQRGEPYHYRAQAHARLKKFETVCEDLEEAYKRGITDVDAMMQKYCH